MFCFGINFFGISAFLFCSVYERVFNCRTSFMLIMAMLYSSFLYGS